MRIAAADSKELKGTEEVTNWRNIRVISLFTFVDSLQYSFFMWSFWPFLQHLDPSIGATFVGLIMALSGVGEALTATIFGFYANKKGRVLSTAYMSIAFSATGNLIYLCLDGFPRPFVPFMTLLCRFFSGCGTGNRGCFRALVAANSLGADRAKALASSGGAALVGLTIGPAVQVLFTWMGPDGLDLRLMKLSQFTSPAAFALLINALSSVYLHFLLDDRLEEKPKADMERINSETTITRDTDDNSDSLKDVEAVKKLPIRMDVLAVIITIGTRGIRMLVTANIESIGSPFTELMFGFSHDDAMSYNSHSQTAVGILTFLTFLLYAFTNYTKWVSERTNCFIALCCLLLFYSVTYPWPFLSGSLDCSRFIGNGTHDWVWCEGLPQVNPWLYYISYVFFYGIALSILNNSLQALYSRVLGSGRQATMQGVSQAVGCIARIFGPIIMSSTFSQWGPQASWGVILVLLTLTLLTWIVCYKRLVPVDIRQKARPVMQSTTALQNSLFTQSKY